MHSVKPFTTNNINDIVNKPLYFFDDDRLNVSNIIHPDDLGFLETYYGEFYSEIVYYEYDRPVCPKCGSSMNSNGSRRAKPNKWEGIRKKQYICPDCKKTQVTSLENFIKRYSNYTRAICQKALEYESISYLPYQKKSELIELENGIRLNRQTVYYHESTYADSFITQKEEDLQKILKEMQIEPSGTYHYDEEYLHENGANIVRLAIIDAVTNLIINDQVMLQEDFDKEFLEIFLKYSLEGLPKKVLITDGYSAYPGIIEKICINHQLCIFHIIKNKRTPSFKKIRKLEKRIKTIKNTLKDNEEKIEELKKYSKGKQGPPGKNDKKWKRNIRKRKNLDSENKRLRKELKQKRKELKEQKNIDERISNIYDVDSQKDAKRRFNTIYNQLEQFDEDTQKFLKNLNKKFDRTTTYFRDPQIPRTNNKIEGYFKITLPKYLKRIYRTRVGLIRWIRLQKIRWTKRNVITHQSKNSPEIQLKNQKIKAAS